MSPSTSSQPHAASVSDGVRTRQRTGFSAARSAWTTFGPTNPVPPVTRITPSILRPHCYRFQARFCGDEKVGDRAVYGRRAGGRGGGVLGGRPRAHCLPQRRASIGLFTVTCPPGHVADVQLTCARVA